MFGSPPKLVIRRTIMIRLLLCLLLLPVSLLAAWGAVVAFSENQPDVVFGSICAALAIPIFGLFAFLFRRESRRLVRVHDEGIVQKIGSRVTEMRWEEIQEVWFDAVRVQVGGLFGVAIGVAVRAAAKKKGILNANTANITIRLVGNSKRSIVLNSNDKGVVAAFEETLAQVNSRLLERAVEAVQHGQAVIFGPISVSSTGISAGRKTPVSFGEIESLVVKGGKLRLKKQGSWLDTFSVSLKKIPNVFVLTDLYHQLSAKGDSVDPVGSNIVRGTFV